MERRGMGLERGGMGWDGKEGGGMGWDGMGREGMRLEVAKMRI